MAKRLYVSPETFLSGRDSPHTSYAYKVALQKFSQYKWGHDNLGRAGSKECDLGQYAKKGDRTQIFEDLTNYAGFLKTEKLSNPTRKLYLTGIRVYLANNELEFNKAQFNKLLPKKIDPTDDLAFDLDTAKKVYDNLTFAGRGVFLFLLSTGARISEALGVELTDITWDSQPCKVKLRCTGVDDSRDVYISNECRDYLRDVWLSPYPDPKATTEPKPMTTRRIEYMKGADIRNSGLMNQKREDRRPGRRMPINEDNRLFPMTGSTFHLALKNAVKRAGYDAMTSSGRAKLHPHSCRKFFRVQVGRWGSPDTAEVLMGHQPGLQSNYRRPPEQQLKDDYTAAMPYVSLGLSPEARTAIAAREEQAVSIAGLQTENIRLSKEVEDLKRQTELYNGIFKQIMDIPQEKLVALLKS